MAVTPNSFTVCTNPGNSSQYSVNTHTETTVPRSNNDTMSDTTGPCDEAEFEDALAALVERANDNGVDIEGGWKSTVEADGRSHWDIQISRVEYEGDGESDDEQ